MSIDFHNNSASPQQENENLAEDDQVSSQALVIETQKQLMQDRKNKKEIPVNQSTGEIQPQSLVAQAESGADIGLSPCPNNETNQMNATSQNLKNVTMEAKSVLVDESHVEMIKMADETIKIELQELLPISSHTFRKQAQTERESLIMGTEDDGESLLDKEAKGENIFGKDAEMYETTFLSTVMTAANYVSADITKKQRSFMIGVYTIFLTVSFVTMLKSVIDVLPFAFLKVGQDQGGAIDFKMESDYLNLIISGDILYYAQDPFKYPEDGEKSRVSILDQIKRSTFQNQGDHAEILGLDLINFDVIDKKLKENLPEDSLIKGFSPRWTLPVVVRNKTNPSLSTNCLLLIIDSKREAEYQFGTGFTDQRISDSEVMLSENAMTYLNISSIDKDSVELYFDIMRLLKTFTSVSDGEFGSTGSRYNQHRTNVFQSAEQDQIKEEIIDEVESQINDALQSLLPSPEEIIRIMRDDFKIEISDTNTVKLDVYDILSQNFDLKDVKVTLPTIKLDSFFPNVDYRIFDINMTTNDPRNPFNGVNLRDFVDGDLNLNLDQLLAVVNANNVSTIELPVETALNIILDINIVPKYMSHTFHVVESFEESDGKFGSVLGNVAIIDCHNAKRFLQSTYQRLFRNMLEDQAFYYVFLQDMDKYAQEFLEQADFCKYAMSVNGILKDQVGTYTNGLGAIETQIGLAGNELMKGITHGSNMTIKAPLRDQLSSANIIVIFTSQGFSSIIVFLALIATQLIYSLMMSDIEDKTYEFGMLRALGFSKTNIIITITYQAVMFIIPGLSAGIVMAWILNFGLRHQVYSVTKNYSSYNLSQNAILVGLSLGIIIPLISNIFPIRRSLDKNLRNSLDLNHRKVGEMTVQFTNLGEGGLNLNQLVMGLTLVGFGIVSYYIIPMAFLFYNYTLLFSSLANILLLATFGMCFLTMLVQPLVQRVVLEVILFFAWGDRRLKPLILKNIDSHQGRNLKTASIFALTLSFLIYASCGMSQIHTVMEAKTKSVVAGDLLAFNAALSDSSVGGDATIKGELSQIKWLDEGPISRYLDEQNAIDGTIKSYSFVSPSLKHLLKIVRPRAFDQVMISDSSGYKSLQANMYSISESYLESTYQEYLILDEVNQNVIDQAKEAGNPINITDSGDPHIIETLFSDYGLKNYTEELDPMKIMSYNNQRSQMNRYARKRSYFEELKVLVPEAYRYVQAMDTNSSARMCLGWPGECNHIYRMSVRGMLSRMPGFNDFTSLQRATLSSDVVITEYQYAAILKEYVNLHPRTLLRYTRLLETYEFKNDVPKQWLYVKFHDNCTSLRKDNIANGIRSYFRDDFTIMLESERLLKTLGAAFKIFDLFQVLMAIISLSLAFFLLLVSTTQNIKENVWEYGCLRAIGFSKQQGMRMFMYEQFAVITSAIILGLVVGVILARVTMAQFFLFTEFPFTWSDFPVFQVTFYIGMSMMTTFWAVYIPVKQVNKHMIANVVKGLQD